MIKVVSFAYYETLNLESEALAHSASQSCNDEYCCRRVF